MNNPYFHPPWKHLQNAPLKTASTEELVIKSKTNLIVSDYIGNQDWLSITFIFYCAHCGKTTFIRAIAFRSLAFQVEMPPFVQILIPHLKAHYKGTFIPPEVASRTVRAPFLFKCCHVGYNTEANRLEIRKGEYVGKTVSAEPVSATRLQDAQYGDPLPVEISTDEDVDLSGEGNRCITAIKT